jgi:hypothetical protein
MEDDNNIQIEDFFIHFDLRWDKHEIPISQSIITEQALITIVEEINNKFFDSKLQFKIIVYSSENWWLVKKFGITTCLIGTFVLWQITPDIINWIVMWLNPNNKEVKHYIQDWTVYLKDIVQWFLEKDNNQLLDAWVKIEDFYKWYDAKNKFYTEAIKNKDVQWLWFDTSHNFPINRWDFNYRVSELNWENSNIEPVDKYHDLLVVSPINTKDDKKLSWQFKDPILKERFWAYMEDKVFYNNYLKNPIYLKKIIVKMRYHIKINDSWEKFIDKKDIIVVYQYNESKLLNLPKEAIIEIAPYKILDEFIENKNINESLKNTSSQTKLNI